MKTLTKTLLATTVAFAFAGSAHAEGCDKVIFSDVGWTDITATTATSALILEAQGYETEIKVLSVPVTYTGLAEGDIDVFLGNWMPTMEADIAPYRDAKTVDTVRTNLEGAKYTLATNEAGAALGITDFAAIAANKDALEGQIYGIEPGNDGNRLIIDMIASGAVQAGRVRSGRILRTGHVGRSEKSHRRRQADSVSGVGAAPNERQFQDDLPDWRR